LLLLLLLPRVVVVVGHRRFFSPTPICAGFFCAVLEVGKTEKGH